ncbi:hypothetical protein PPERSA_08782 [Pseudocohnilembus persalinus]|uniref:Amino acid transporter transmembrane domain-containing protein n=1 Tax=Pseudocohnilembus persalinus TaxID=266149 RepID=A0A0V0R7Y9_PSEPJ|nr:hypothetical protein PPERSA_08782 [Pseudocohnilembus persalinus]|eukprot:KRX10480.1 hypothetical protein PPERSA_08782 [Pseudocohnilembus persalinus]
MVQAEIDKNTDPKSLQVNSSYNTITSLLNQMVGGTMLVLPLLFNQNGIIGGFFNMMITGIIEWRANLIYIDHFKEKEFDYQDTILRILGPKYEKLFKWVKWLYLFFIIMIYFYMIVLQLYDVFLFFFEISHLSTDYFVPPTDKNQFVFDRFSIPYMTLISFAICFGLVSLKNLSFLIVIAGYGVWTIISFVVFILIVFFDQLFSNKNFAHDVSDITLFSWDIGKLAGTGAMAFAVHINTASGVKCNKNQNNNKRDVSIVYLCGFLIYEIIGVLGALGIKSMGCDIESANTITDCFSSTNVATLLVIIIYVSHLISAFPIYYKLSRDGLLVLLFGEKEVSQKTKQMIDIGTLTLFAIIANIPKLSPDDIMSLNGSVCCFFYVYLIPLMMDFQCYHGGNKLMMKIKRSLSTAGFIHGDNRPRFLSTKEQQLKLQHYNEEFERERFLSQAQDKQKVLENAKLNLDSENQQSLISNDEKRQRELDEERQQIEKLKEEAKNKNIDEIQQTEEQIKEERERRGEDKDDEHFEIGRKYSCNNHDEDESNKTAKVIIYSIIGLIGLAILLYEIVIVTEQLIKSFYKKQNE